MLRRLRLFLIKINVIGLFFDGPVGEFVDIGDDFGSWFKFFLEFFFKAFHYVLHAVNIDDVVLG